MCVEVVMLRDVGDVLLLFCVVNMSAAMNSCGQRLARRHCDFNFCNFSCMVGMFFLIQKNMNGKHKITDLDKTWSVTYMTQQGGVNNC